MIWFETMRRRGGFAASAAPWGLIAALILTGLVASTAAADDQAPSVEPVELGARLPIDVEALPGWTHRLEIERLGWGDDDRVVQDYSGATRWRWTPTRPGLFRLRVLGRPSTDAAPIEVLGRLVRVESPHGAQSIVPTHHPLVALYTVDVLSSFEPGALLECLRACVLRVEAIPQDADLLPSVSETDLSLLDLPVASVVVAGLAPDTRHTIQATLLTAAGAELASPEALALATPPIDFERPPLLVASESEEAAGEVPVDPFVFFSELRFDGPMIPYAMGLDGTIRWYDTGERSTSLFRVATHGRFLGVSAPPVDEGAPNDLVVRDLLGNDLRRLPVARANEQLHALGPIEIIGFHHDVTMLPDGRLAVLAYELREIAEPGSTEPRTIVGDVVLVVDDDLAITWAWSAFDHLDVERRAVLGEICRPPGAGCPALPPGVAAEDWTHSNGVEYDARDGSLMLSVRNQDWLVKIDYADGDGEGEVLWSLGAEGDFELEGATPEAWFSHQHDARWLGDGRLVVFDNGNTACRLGTRPCESRGQVWHVDERRWTARPELNVGLETYAFALGASHQLSDGGLFFTAGLASGPYRTVLVEVDANGEPRRRLVRDGLTYRSYRVPGLVRPERPATPADSDGSKEPLWQAYRGARLP